MHTRTHALPVPQAPEMYESNIPPAPPGLIWWEYLNTVPPLPPAPPK